MEVGEGVEEVGDDEEDSGEGSEEGDGEREADGDGWRDGQRARVRCGGMCWCLQGSDFGWGLRKGGMLSGDWIEGTLRLKSHKDKVGCRDNVLRHTELTTMEGSTCVSAVWFQRGTRCLI